MQYKLSTTGKFHLSCINRSNAGFNNICKLVAGSLLSTILVNVEMYPVRALLLLFLSSVCGSLAAPLTCEQLLRPLDQLDPHALEGTWALVAGSISHLPFMERFRVRDSATSSFSTNGTGITMVRSMRLDDQCSYMSVNVSLEGSGFSFSHNDVNATFTRAPCGDCMLMRFEVKSGARIHFYLFSRRRQLEEQELQEFRRQAECLKMPPPHVMDPTKELCPQEAVGNESHS